MANTTLQPGETDLELLSSYIDNQLAAHERQAIEARLGTEPALRQALDDLRETVNLLRTVPAVAPPRSFTLDPALAQPRRRWSLATLWPAFGGLVAVLVAAFFVSQMSGAGSVAMTGAAQAPQSGDIALAPTTAAAAAPMVAEAPPAPADTEAPAATAAPESAMSAPAAGSAPAEPNAPKTGEATTASDPAADMAAAATVAPPDLSSSRSSSPDTAAVELPVPPVAAAAPARTPLIAVIALLALGGAAFVVWIRRRNK